MATKIEFIRDKETGELIGYKDGKPIGAIHTMDEIIMEDLKKEAEEKEKEVKRGK